MQTNKLDASELDQLIDEAADWFVKQTKALSGQFEGKIEIICEAAKEAEIPPHLLAASLHAAHRKIDKAVSQHSMEG